MSCNFHDEYNYYEGLISTKMTKILLNCRNIWPFSSLVTCASRPSCGEARTCPQRRLLSCKILLSADNEHDKVTHQYRLELITTRQLLCGGSWEDFLRPPVQVFSNTTLQRLIFFSFCSKAFLSPGIPYRLSSLIKIK